MIPIQILRVLSTIRKFDVHALLMGGQACVLYGAAEYSRDLDLAVLATDEALPSLTAALKAMQASVIAVPPFDLKFLRRGHAVHFSIPHPSEQPLRVDVMSRMRGVEDFPSLWERRTTIALQSSVSDQEVIVEVMALEDLVAAKKTQRDKDWPMIRRLVDASYAAARDDVATEQQVDFWLAELRSPEFLEEVVRRYPEAAARSTRIPVHALLSGGDVDATLLAEQTTMMAADREYWAPLRRELEALRHDARRNARG